MRGTTKGRWVRLLTIFWAANVGYAAEATLSRPGRPAIPVVSAYTHLSRPLPRAAILNAIQSDLARRGAQCQPELQAEELKIQAAVPALEPDAGLEVKQIVFDPVLRRTTFELRASRQPQYLPFTVTVDRNLESLGLGVPSPRQTPGTHPGSAAGGRAVQATAPVLARRGRAATLVMLGEDVRITTTVIPLQPGVMGQVIQVRNPATGRQMAAQVVGEALLQTSF